MITDSLYRIKLLGHNGVMIFSALVPPGNIIKELDIYKQRLFSLFGTVSSLVLPPLLPLVGDDLDSGGKVLLPHCRTGTILVREEGLYLNIHRAEGGLNQDHASPPPSEEPLPRPLLVPHLFLMDWRGEGFKTPPELPAPPDLSWKKGALVTFEMVVESRGFWWEQVFLKELLQRPHALI